MALRDQPYFPLYVQDFLTDEKLMECSASSTGIYIRILCIMHKSDPYGTILLKQKDKQSSDVCSNFALKLARFLPYKIDEIYVAIEELISEGVLIIENDKLVQRRMVRDNEISKVRSEAGKKGGDKTQSFAKAKVEANTENENENENINKDINVIIEEEIKIESKMDKETLLARKKRLLEIRRETFWNLLLQHEKEYNKEMLQRFFNYWTETNKSGSQMKYEMEATWETDKRLQTWKRNDEKFNEKKGYHATDF